MISAPQEIEKKLIQTTSVSHQRNVARVKRDEEELEAERRMRAILQNGNNGEHYEQDP